MPEHWLRGAVPRIPAELQPVAHALLQALEDIERIASPIDADDLWRAPAGAAPLGFHIRHMTGSLDRLLTYARGQQLSDAQRANLAAEKLMDATLDDLIHALREGINAALAQLAATDPSTLLHARAVGRDALPSTVLGLLYHAGEHTARHAGQAVTTARFIGGAT